MKIKVLIEDTSDSAELIAEHGLSIYIETPRHRLLVDTGASPKTWENAEKLDINLKSIDTVILSHGHYDHAGGILSFTERNNSAAIYMHEKADGEYYSERENGIAYIGIDKRIADLKQIRKVNGFKRIDSELSVFSDVQERRLWPSSNKRLKRLVGGKYIQDDFEHEQYAVIEAEGKTILLSGCAHNGILNILSRFEQLYHRMPAAVISGMHTCKKRPYTIEEISLFRSMAEELKGYNTVFYTGHCTGEQAFEIFRSIMGEQIRKISTGSCFEI